jgi:endogenous inhibitor of DNA gyrase (YacG/DUF329 family)
MTDTKKKPEVSILGRKCPNCRKYATLEFRPFCTKRCADMDLSRWLTGGYSIPGNEATSLAEGVYEED